MAGAGVAQEQELVLLQHVREVHRSRRGERRPRGDPQLAPGGHGRSDGQAELVDPFITYTRQAPPGWTGYARRIDRAMLQEAVIPPDRGPRVYVCGPTGLVEGVAADLVALGHDPSRIRTERFGATGG